MFNSKKVAVITLLGTLAFVSNGFLPSPIDKMVIGIQALCFSLAALLVAKGGAIYASFVTGLLLSILRPGFFPFSLVFSVFYGLLIEGFFYFFKVNDAKCVKSRRLILLLTVATGITGVVSMYLTTMMGIIPDADNVSCHNRCSDSQWSHSGLFYGGNLEPVSFSSFSLMKGGFKMVHVLFH